MRVGENYIPMMTHHRARNQARVILNGKEVYLGRWGLPETRARYDEVIAQWIDAGRVWPPPATAADAAASLTMVSLGDLYLEHAARYYRKGDRTTTSYDRIAAGLALLYRAGLGKLALSDFGPQHLKRYAEWLAEAPGKPWSRSTINTHVQTIVAMVRWAVSEQLAEPEKLTALKSVSALRRGRPAHRSKAIPREGEPVEPVPQAHLDAVLKHARPMLAAMIRVQLLTAMRPLELLAMRCGDISPAPVPDVWVYAPRPEGDKLDHIEHVTRLVYLGPRAIAEIRPWLTDDPDDYVWSPRRAEQMRLAEQWATRKTPRWPSHTAAARKARRKPKGKGPARLPGERYTTASYRRAIERAGEDAKLKPEELWTPGQLRHNAATYIAEHEAVEVAQILLGHTSIRTTMRYVQADARRAMLAVLRRG